MDLMFAAGRQGLVGAVAAACMIAVSAGPAAAAGSDRDFAVVRADGPGHVSLQVLDSTGAVRRTLVESIGALECPTWSPDGSKIAYEDGSTYPERLKVVAATGARRPTSARGHARHGRRPRTRSRRGPRCRRATAAWA